MSDAKQSDKKSNIESAVGTILTEQDFLRLGQLSRKITDYSITEADTANALEDTGVAVIIDEDDEAEAEDTSHGSESDSDVSDQEYEDLDQLTDFSNEDTIVPLVSGSVPDQSRIPANEIDGFWLQRTIASHYPTHIDAHLHQAKAAEVLALLESPVSSGVLENDLMELFEFDKFALVQRILRNRESILWLTKLSRATDEKEIMMTRKKMLDLGLSQLLDELDGKSEVSASSAAATVPENKVQPSQKPIDLEALIFTQGNHLMSNKKVSLPEGSFKRSHASYEEVHVPAPKKADSSKEKKVSIADMPAWTHDAFKNTDSLNRIQSKMYDTAFGSDANILLCAPTGAGKTNVAMLCILQELSKHRLSDGRFDLDSFKIVYIAPLKALVSEMVGNFTSRLKSFDMKVSELTGDSQLTKQQISATQIIVTTPEKWDVITRKASDTSYTTLVRLIIIDEIHLLHDDRGPVIESIVTRVHRRSEEGGEPIRLVGLSATLPNYTDVAAFLRVETNKGLFYFDQSYRPCPLKQEFIGVTEKKPVKRLQVMNSVCYEKVLESVSKQNQVLIFVHSRKETYKTAKSIRDQALENDTIQRILRSDAASREILTREAESIRDPSLKELLPYGLAMHHAGMSKADRTTAEDLFADGLVQVLVSTATLAWGVNLPAHTVIIKGTQVYSPEKGTWVELSPQDVLQMLGRAGRPQYDTYGEGIIITTQAEMQYYLSLINQQLPIESQFVSRMADNMNAEIVLGTIKTIQDAVAWLGDTYLYIRMLQAPVLYKVGAEYADDPTLVQKRIDLAHSAATLLQRCNLLKYNVSSGIFQSTELGRIASHYYVTHSSMKTYNTHLKPTLGMIELFKVFALSEEFKYIPVREDEKLEIVKLLERVPIPVRESPDESNCKINVLLQAYISRMKLDGFALLSDMVYVTQSAGRIMRSIFEICLKRGWSHVARTALEMCKMIEHRLWSTRSPLAQFADCTSDMQRRLERKEFPWSRYFDLDPEEVGELTGDARSGRLVYRLIHQFPRLQVSASVQPITRSLLRVELSINSDFEWDQGSHGASELFWILVEDVDGERILFHDRFLLKRQYLGVEHVVDFTVPIMDPIPPHYFVTLISDRWLHAENKVAIPFRHMSMPSKFPAHTPLLDLQALPTSALKNPRFEQLYRDFEEFNAVQTQTFNTLYQTDDSVLIAAPRGSGKSVCAELAILRLWVSDQPGLVVYINPVQCLVDSQHDKWARRFASLDKHITKFGDDLLLNAKLAPGSDIILATVTQWEQFSRRWRQRRAVQEISLLIGDQIHLLGGQNGAIYEVAVSRSRYISAQTDRPLRILALSIPLADPRDARDWLGISTSTTFNFSPAIRSDNLEIHLRGHTITHYPSFMLSLVKPVVQELSALKDDQLSIVYVANRKDCLDMALDMALIASGLSLTLVSASSAESPGMSKNFIDRALADSVSQGIAYIHEGLCAHDVDMIQELFRTKALRVMLVARTCATQVKVTPDLVIIMGTQYYEGSQHRYIDYPISDIVYMLGSSRPSTGARKALILTSDIKKDYYEKFLDEALPIESQYPAYIYDNFITEISAQTIESKQEAIDWLTWTFFYRRLASNPAYYGLEDADHDQVSAFLSDMVEDALSELNTSKMVEIGEDDMELSILNLGLISSHYAISYLTMQTFALSLTERTKLKGLLEIVTSAAEFDSLAIRRHEDLVLRRLYDRLPVKLDIDFEDPHHKAFILVQAHFSRLQLPSDLNLDKDFVIALLPKLLSACVDILSTEGFVNAVNAIEMSQMCIQALWDSDSPLKQLPFFDDEMIARCIEAGVEDIAQIAELEDNVRDSILQLSAAQLNQVALFCNRYPDVEVEAEVLEPGNLVANESAIIKVSLRREAEEDEVVDQIVVASHYPVEHRQHWWIIIADAKSLLGIKKVTLQHSLVANVEFMPNAPGKHSITVSLFSDSYAGLDQEQSLDINVAAQDDDEMEM